MNYGVLGRAIKESKAHLQIYNPRKYSTDIHQTVDDRPYGGGDGMVMLAENLDLTLGELKDAQELGEIYYLSPQGPLWNDEMAVSWANERATKTLICGRYGGIDQRVLQKHKIMEISIGDYILSGGELAAMVVVDSVFRKLPGVLGNELSAISDSFSKMGLLEAPLYTRPAIWQDRKVPAVLLSGHHEKIETAKDIMSYIVTALKRPDLIEKNGLHQSLKKALQEVSQWDPQELLAWGVEQNNLAQLKKTYLGEDFD